MSERKTIVITGASKKTGLGYNVVKQLCGNGKYFIIPTYRNASSFKDVYADVEKKDSEICGMELDITKKDSIAAFKKKLEDKKIEIDVLVNNAGVLHFTKKGSFHMDINFTGTMNFTKAMFPLMKKGSTIINVSSRLGCCDGMNMEYKNKFLEAKSEEELLKMVDSYMEDLKNEEFEKKTGFKPYFSSYYCVSKLALNGLTKIYAKKNKIIKDKDITILSCCPGWCKTDLGTDQAPRTASEGGDSITYLVENAKGDKFHGLFFGEKKQIDFTKSNLN